MKTLEKVCIISFALVTTLLFSTSFAALPKNQTEINHIETALSSIQKLVSYPSCEKSIPNAHELISFLEKHPTTLQWLNENDYETVLPGTYLKLGQCHETARQLDKALDYFNQGKNLVENSENQPNNRLYLNTGYIRTLWKSGDYAATEAALNTFMNKPYIESYGYVVLDLRDSTMGLMRMAQKRYEESEAYFKTQQKRQQELGQMVQFAGTTNILHTLQLYKLKADAPHYIVPDEHPIIRFHDKTTAIRIYYDQTTLPEEWTDERIALFRSAFREWLDVLDNRIEYQEVKKASDADIKISLAKNLRHIPGHAEDLGVSLRNVKKNRLYRNDLVMGLFYNTGETMEPENFYGVALHEIGHLFGMPHSTTLDDVMVGSSFRNFGVPAANHLSERDKASLRYLYTLKPDITNDPTRPIAQTR